MSKDISQEFEELQQKLEVIIVLLASQVLPDSKLALKEQVKILRGYGLQIPEIAKVLGKTTGHVSKEVSLIKKEK